MGIFKKIFGICETKPPANNDCWTFSDQAVEIDLSITPELLKSGGAVRLEGKGLPERIMVFHGNDGKYYVIRNKCSHAGRRIDPLPGTQQIKCCSVMGSTYDYKGRVVSGAAKKNLDTFKVITDQNKLKIGLS